MKRTSAMRLCALPLLLCSLIAVTPARGDITLSYTGDYNNVDAQQNQALVPINTGSGYSLQTVLGYDSFVVPVGQTWTISSVFSIDQLGFYSGVTDATWDIRSGVSAANGGTLIASGNTAATLTVLPPVNGYYYADPETKIAAAVTGVTLTAGTYWLAVAPTSAGYYGDQSYVETTSGANAIGSPPDSGQTFVYSNYPGSGLNYVAGNSILSGEGTIDYSMGLVGTATLAVPEPSSISLVVFLGGIAGLSALNRRRLKSAPKPL